MRKGLLGSLATLLTGAGVALAQAPPADLVPAFLRKPAQEAAAADGADPAFALPDSEALLGVPPLAAPAPKPSFRAKKLLRKWERGDKKEEKNADDKDVFSVPDDGNAFTAPRTDCPPPPHAPLFGGPKPETPHVPIEPAGRFWASAEYLYWFTKNEKTGPLVTTGTANSGGVPGAPGTTVLYDTASFGPVGGYRVSAGVANQDGDLGIEGNFFQLWKSSAGFATRSDTGGNPLLARGATNALTGGPIAYPIAFPGALAGQVLVHADSRFWGANAYFVCPLCCDDHFALELLAGFQYLDLSEDVTYNQLTTVLPLGAGSFGGNALVAPSTVNVGEFFGTRNQFYGGEVGGQMEVRFGNYFINAIGKLGVGNTHEVATIAGFTSANQGGAAQVLSGGVSAVPGALGRSSQERFALVPEVNVNLGFDLSKCVRLYLGYTFIYWSDVLRPGDLAAMPVTPGLVPTDPTFGSAAQAAPNFKHTDYFAQGVNFGVAIRY